MPLPYDLSNLTNITGIDTMMLTVNNLTGQLYFGLIPPSLFIILFVAGMRFGGKISFLGASFITALLTLVLYTTGGVPSLELYATLILLFFALVINFVVKD
jgi:hypothetical protein